MSSEEDQKIAAADGTADPGSSSPPTAEADGYLHLDHPAGSSPARRAKPALKKHHGKSPSPASSAPASGSAPRDPDHHPGGDASKHHKWDEKAIEEHDLLRGTRMKIDEPNTPYTHYDSGAESDDSRRAKSPANQKPALSWDVLQTRLDSVAAVREAYPSSPSSSHNAHETDQSLSDADDNNNGGSNPDDQKKKEMRVLEFKEHRKRHYNEMELVRKYRQEHPDGIDADPDADEDDRSGDLADVENED
jgi:protein phosphatase inhibitor 2